MDGQAICRTAFIFSRACFATVTCLNCLSYCKVEGQQVICILNIFRQRQFHIIQLPLAQWKIRKMTVEINYILCDYNDHQLLSNFV